MNFIPYLPPAEVTNVMIKGMAEEYESLQVRCKAFEDALADLEDQYEEEIYPDPEWDEKKLSPEDQELTARIRGQAIRLACNKLRESVEELCKANGIVKS